VGAWGYAATLAAVGMLPVLLYALVHGWRQRTAARCDCGRVAGTCHYSDCEHR
jgi:hypothetical protein